MLLTPINRSFVEGLNSSTQQLQLPVTQNTTAPDQNKPHGWFCFGKSLASKVQIIFFTAGCIANIIIIVYFVIRHGKRKASPAIPTTASTRRKPMSSYHFLLVLLAIADLFACGILLLTSYQYLWSSSNWYCRLGSMVLEASSTFSIWSLVLLFYERYHGIVHRFNKMRKRTYLLISLLSFVLSWVAFLPEIFEVNLQSDGACVVIMSYTKLEFYALFFYYRALDTVMPTASMFYFRWRISRYISNVTNNVSDALPRTTSHTAQIRRLQNSRTALRTINWLFGFYTLLIAPWRIVYSVAMYTMYFNNAFMEHYEKLLTLIYAVIYLLYFMNNVVNILVYAVLIPDFRKFLRKIFTCGIVTE